MAGYCNLRACPQAKQIHSFPTANSFDESGRSIFIIRLHIKVYSKPFCLSKKDSMTCVRGLVTVEHNYES